MKVFLVEDADNIRELIRFSILEAGGVVVGESASQSHAVKIIPVIKPDIVVVDLMLADGNGIGVLREVRKIMPEIKMIVLTNQERNQLERICLESGADYFFEKSAEDYSRFESLLHELMAVHV